MMFQCACPSCGKEKIVKEKRSCKAICKACAGKLAAPARYKKGNADGRSLLPQYYSWKDMQRRVATCKTYLKNKIAVCEDWLDFWKFNAWVEKNNYIKGYHLDRINPSLGYSPENCRFISPQENTSRVSSITKIDIELIIQLYIEGKSIQEIYNTFYGEINAIHEEWPQKLSG